MPESQQLDTLDTLACYTHFSHRFRRDGSTLNHDDAAADQAAGHTSHIRRMIAVGAHGGQLFQQVGAMSLRAMLAVGQLSVMQLNVFIALFEQPQRRRTLVDQLYRIGFESLPVVILTGLSTGLVLAVQSYHTLRQVAGETMTGATVNFALITTLGPVLTGLMLAGRVGSSIAAELGSMKVTEQIDALRVMGTNPTAFLVAPRFIACALLLPVLTAICVVIGMAAAAILANMVWGLDMGAYWEKHADTVHTWEIFTGLGKSVFFGCIIALVACRRGLRTTGGASGVGAACTEAVVTASICILLSDFVFTVLLQRLGEAL